MPDQDNPTRGIGILVFATTSLAIQNTLTKQQIEALSVFQIVTVRFFFFALLAFTFATRRIEPRAGFRSKSPGLQKAHILLITAEITLFAVTFRYRGIADVHTIVCCFPPLGKSIGQRQWLAGCIDDLAVQHPDTESLAV